MGEPQPAKDTLSAFLATYWKDQEAGRERSLREYLELFPDDRVAEEFIVLRQAGADAAIGRASVVPEPGARLGPYVLTRAIGQGGMGVVYEARDRRVDRLVAIKFVRPDLVVGRDSAESRFHLEALVASRLELPGICRVYEARLDEERPFIVMQLVEGDSLKAKIVQAAKLDAEALGSTCVGLEEITDDDATQVIPQQDRRREEVDTRAIRASGDITKVLRVIERVARTLHEVHERGVIHRDIKPANIMVRPDGQAVIMDFGLAYDESSTAEGLTEPGQFPGTPEYMSPEQLSTHVMRLDRRTDIWSLGVTLFECLTLERPFRSPTRRAEMEAVLRKDAPNLGTRNRFVPRDLAVVVETALRKDPDRRYQTALEFAEELARVRRGEPVRARPVSRFERAILWTRRNPVVAASTIVAFLSLTIGLAVATTAWFEAETARQESDDRARELSRRQQLYDEMATASRVEKLNRTANDLWPRRPELVPAMQKWLADGEEVLATLASLAETFQALDQTEGPLTDREEFHKLVLTRLVQDEQQTLLALREAMRRRLSVAETIVAGTAGESSWAPCLEELRQSKEYEGLQFAPLVGFVPLRRDPKSGFWEFWLRESGARPRMDRQKDRWRIGPETGMVFVLLPGGDEVLIGAQRGDPDDAYHDPTSGVYDQPVHPVKVSPFLMSRYEMTQGQWSRIMGFNPAQVSPHTGEGKRVAATPVHPVENVSWLDAHEATRRYGLRLPFESEWEYACRAGTDTQFATGSKLLDANVRRAPPGLSAQEVKRQEEAGDGYMHHAPVGSFAPNGFGLHDLHGNVREWCFNRPFHYPAEGGDHPDERSLSAGEGNGQAILRGGSYSERDADAGSARRYILSIDARQPVTGVRPVAEWPRRRD